MPIKSNTIPEIKNHEIFLSRIRINKENECWEWQGALDKNGYGHYSPRVYGKKSRYLAHRISYSIFVKQLTPGLLIDHICRNKKCVNPDHIREVTPQVNMIENSESITYLNHIKTHCIRGHEFTPENTRIQTDGRYCRACGAWHTRNHRAKKK